MFSHKSVFFSAKEHWIGSIKDRLLEKLGMEETNLPNISQRLTLPMPLEMQIEQQYSTQADDSFRNLQETRERKLDIFSAKCAIFFSVTS